MANKNIYPIRLLWMCIGHWYFICQCQVFIPETWQSHPSLFQAREHLNCPHWQLSYSSYEVSKGVSALRDRNGTLVKSTCSEISKPESPFTSCMTPLPHFRFFICGMRMRRKNIIHLRGLLWVLNQSVHEKCTEQCLECSKRTENVSHHNSPRRWYTPNF